METSAVDEVHGLASLPGVGRFGVGEVEGSIGAPLADVGISLNGGFAAEFENMVSAHPSQAGVGGTLLFKELRVERAPNSVCICKKGRGPTRGSAYARPSACRRQCRRGARRGHSAHSEYGGEEVLVVIPVHPKGILVERLGNRRLVLVEVTDADVQKQRRPQ